VTTPEPAEAPDGADRADPTFEMLPGDKVPFTTAHLLAHLQIEADFVVDRVVIARGQRLVLRDLLQRAHDEIERLSDDNEALRAEIERLRAEVAFLERLVMNVAVRCVRDPEVAEDMVADEREQMRS